MNIEHRTLKGKTEEPELLFWDFCHKYQNGLKEAEMTS